MSAETVTVQLGQRSYPVRIGSGVRREALATAEQRLSAGQKCVAITSPGVVAAQSGFAAELARLMPVLATAADGETAKSAAELARLWDFLAAHGVARDGAVFALGGGVIGDLAGFAAASYQRGVDFYQVPTTLLAMVDSSVGELPVPPPGGTFLQSLRENRDSVLDGFVREMYAKPRPEAEITALLKDVKRMSLENSIALLSSGIPREHWKACAHAFKKPLLYVVTPQFEEQARNLEKNRPGTCIDLFADAGHALFVDEPERFNCALFDFSNACSKKLC